MTTPDTEFESVKRILLRSGKGPFDVLSPEATLETSLTTMGGNVGNLVFSHAAHKLLTRSDTVVTSNGFKSVPEDAPRINDEYDVFVVSLANAFRPTFTSYLEVLTSIIEQLTIPVVVLGVGAQASERDLTQLTPLNDGVSRFLRAVLDRSASVGVRGAFTADYVQHLGFNDVEVIGCPSMFMFGPNFPEIRKADALLSSSRVAFNASRKPESRGLGPIVDRARATYSDLTYLMQDSWDLELLLWGERREGITPNGLPNHVSHPMYQENRLRFFCDPWTWIDYLADFDFSFGTRIHGNIVALLAGTPAYVLAHDSRTKELAEYFQIPHRQLHDCPSDLEVVELFEDADYGPLRAGHAARFEIIEAFMAKNGLEHCYSEGGDPAAFEERVRETAYPRGVEALPVSSNDELVQRLRYLRSRTSRDAEKISELKSSLKTSRKQSQALERSLGRTQERHRARAERQQAQLAKQAKRIHRLESRLAQVENRGLLRRLRARLRRRKPS